MVEIQEKTMKKLLDLNTSGGDHCITCSLKQVFGYYRWNISEAMILGLGEGLGFVYLNASESPLISCRSKPFVFEKNLERLPGLKIDIRKPVSEETAFEGVLKQIDHGRPVIVYTDMVFLPYLNMGESSHFGGHSVVIFGYDTETRLFHVSDRDNRDNPTHLREPLRKIFTWWIFPPWPGRGIHPSGPSRRETGG